MRHLRQKMGIITPIPVANDVNRDEALIRTPIPVANGANRYEAIISISEELQRQNDRLQLLLNLTSRITSSLDLREVLRAIAANIRQVIQADLVTVSLPDGASGQIRVFAMDFPHGKGLIKEDLLVAPSIAAKKAMDTLKPVVLDSQESDNCVSGSAEGIRTQCIIPLVNRDRVLGLLCPSRTTETPFVPEDVDFLSRASGQIAIAIDNRGRRKDRTFVKLNCAAIPTGLLESELFGHEKGAFTGAITQKIGRLDLADQGTLFLDEVGDIPIEIQPKLLRALQEREFERLGSTHTRKVNVRLVAATNRNLEKMVADREFRSDLFYRLNVFPIRIPSLRERPDDIPLLVRYFAQKY